MAENCKVYTPKEYVIEVLDAVGYIDNLYGRSVLENSCGIGDILCTVVERYIKSSFLEGYTINDIRIGLERDICGTEIDSLSVEECKHNLSVIAERCGITNVEWNIIKCDYLRYNMERSFDFVIGNPPYIVYRDIDKVDQDFIRETFDTCKKWKFDYYYAFIEKSVKDLSEDGKMAYIVPYSLYKNEGSAAIRELIKPYVFRIIDYTHSCKFPGIVTSSTVLLIQKKDTATFEYYDVNSKVGITIEKNKLSTKWLFIAQEKPSGKYRFSDYYNVTNTIATLYNKAFVLNDFKVENEYYIVGDDKIEKGIVKPAISRKKGKKAKDVAIIFPYYFVNGNLVHYSEQQIKKQYPGAVKYLEKNKKELECRASDKKAKWFEYGRSQALTKVLAPKIVIPSIETHSIKASIVSADTIPLAGLFITAKSNTHTLDEAKRLLESEDFFEHLCACGIFTTGHSRRISVKDVLAYTFNEWL